MIRGQRFIFQRQSFTKAEHRLAFKSGNVACPFNTKKNETKENKLERQSFQGVVVFSPKSHFKAAQNFHDFI